MLCAMRTTVRLDDATRAAAAAIARRYGLETVSDGIRLAVADVHRRMTDETRIPDAETRAMIEQLEVDVAVIKRRLSMM